MVGQTEPVALRTQRFSFAVRLQKLHFPFSFNEIRPIIEKAGYDILERITSDLPELPSGARLSVSGPIAHHPVSGTTFKLDMEKNTIGITGQDIATVLAEFQKLEELIRNTLLYTVEDEARFYEYTCEIDALVRNHDPLSDIGSLFQDSSAMSRFGSVLSTDPISYGLRLAARDTNPGDDRWFDIRIEPSVSRPTSNYLVNVVYRDRQKSEVVSSAHGLIGRIEALLGILSDPEGN